MKILHIVGNMRLPQNPEKDRLSGVVRVALEVARAQAERGHESWLVSVGKENWESEWKGVRLRQLKAANWARLKLGGRELDFRVHVPYIGLTLSQSFDVIQGYLYPYQRFLRAKLRVADYQTDPFYDGTHVHIPRMSAYIDGFVGTSRYISSQLERALENHPAKRRIYTIYNGVDSGRFNPSQYGKERQELRQKWTAGPDDTVFVYSGAIVPEKGVMELVEAFERLVAQNPRVRLVLAGGSGLWQQNLVEDDTHSYEAQVRARIAPLQAQGLVHPLGLVPVAEIPKVYAAADAAIVPSVWPEPFALVALEAMANDLPVIASNVGGLPEPVGDTGLIVPGGSIEALAGAMKSLADDPVRRKTLGKAAGARAREFTWAKVAEEFDAVYAKLLGGNQPQPVTR